jgi:hypothetical protein
MLAHPGHVDIWNVSCSMSGGAVCVSKNGTQRNCITFVQISKNSILFSQLIFFCVRTGVVLYYIHVVHGVPKHNIYTYTVDVTGTVVTCPPGT